MVILVGCCDLVLGGEAEVLCLIGQWGCSFSLETIRYHQCNKLTVLCVALNQSIGDHLCLQWGERGLCLLRFPVGSGAVWISVLDWGSILCCSSVVKFGRSQTQAGEFQHWPWEKSKCPLKVWASPRYLPFLVLFFCFFLLYVVLGIKLFINTNLVSS